MKVGIDIHGVADTYEWVAQLSEVLVESGHEVHIITGMKKDKGVLDELSRLNVKYTHYFSIVDYLTDNNVEISWDEKGFPWAPKEDWNMAKRSYCAEVGIDFILDDSPTYMDTFKDIPTTFCLVDNTDRVIYERNR